MKWVAVLMVGILLCSSSGCLTLMKLDDRVGSSSEVEGLIFLGILEIIIFPIGILDLIIVSSMDDDDDDDRGPPPENPPKKKRKPRRG
jgi:hypothetical protein